MKKKIAGNIKRTRPQKPIQALKVWLTSINFIRFKTILICGSCNSFLIHITVLLHKPLSTYFFPVSSILILLGCSRRRNINVVTATQNENSYPNSKTNKTKTNKMSEKKHPILENRCVLNTHALTILNYQNRCTSTHTLP